jgi:HPt (histidine-containing phosphotransfer) domain-containing protein
MSKPSGEDAVGPAIDLQVLRDATGGDRDLMQELAELYVSDADLQLRALTDALDNNELDRIKRIGHTLSGASASVGAATAAGVFRDLEAAAKAGETDRIRGLIERSTSEFARVRRALADLR